MPFLPKSLAQLDEEKKKLQNSTNISGTSNTFDIPGANQSSTAPKAEKKSGSWTNLNKYLDTNKEQAASMADKVTSDIDSTANQAQTKIDQFKVDAPKAIESISSQQIKDTYFNAPDVSKKEDYSTLKATGGYSGPSDVYGVDGFADTENLVNKADTKLKQSQTEGGRQELLKDAYKRPTYSHGQSTLDNLLVQNDAGSKAKFENTQSKWAGLTNMLDGARGDISNTIQSNVSKAQANKNLFPQAEEEYVNSFLNPIQKRADQHNSTIPTRIQNVTSDISDDVLSEATMRELGLNEGQNLYNTVLANYLKTDATQANANNVATADERAKYLALMNLISKDATDITAEGKATTPISFDKDRFMSDVSAKQVSYENEYNNVHLPVYSSLLSSDGAAYTTKYDGSTLGGQPFDMSTATPKQLEALVSAMKASPYATGTYKTPIKDIETALNNFYSKHDSKRTVRKG